MGKREDLLALHLCVLAHPLLFTPLWKVGLSQGSIGSGPSPADLQQGLTLAMEEILTAWMTLSET